jgi:hypothetical protein
MPRRLSIIDHKNAAITIGRTAYKAERLVYIAVVNKRLAYLNGKSRIAYIGTTRKGATRIAASAAFRAQDLLKLHGVHEVEFFVIECTRRQNAITWKKLERALLLVFRQTYGNIPWCNSQGRHFQWTDEAAYFSESRLKTILARYEK